MSEVSQPYSFMYRLFGLNNLRANRLPKDSSKSVHASEKDPREVFLVNSEAICSRYIEIPSVPCPCLALASTANEVGGHAWHRGSP